MNRLVDRNTPLAVVAALLLSWPLGEALAGSAEPAAATPGQPPEGAHHRATPHGAADHAQEQRAPGSIGDLSRDNLAPASSRPGNLAPATAEPAMKSAPHYASHGEHRP